MLNRTDGFILYGKLGVHFFSTSEIPEMLQPNMEPKLCLINARPDFNVISNNPNVSLGIVDCSLYTLRVALNDDHHEKRMNKHALTPVYFNSLESLAKTSFIPARRNRFIHQNIFKNAPVRRIAVAMNTNSVFNGSFTKTPFRYQQFDLKQIRKLREVSQLYTLMPLKNDVHMLRQWKQ